MIGGPSFPGRPIDERNGHGGEPSGAPGCGLAQPDGRRLGRERAADSRGHRRGPIRGRAGPAPARDVPPRLQPGRPPPPRRDDRAVLGDGPPPGRGRRGDCRRGGPSRPVRGRPLQRDGAPGRRQDRRPGGQGKSGDGRRPVREPLLPPLAPRPARRLPGPRRDHGPARHPDVPPRRARHGRLRDLRGRLEGAPARLGLCPRWRGDPPQPVGVLVHDRQAPGPPAAGGTAAGTIASICIRPSSAATRPG